jgi:ankyrin repeat protein
MLVDAGADVKLRSKIVTPTGGRGGPQPPTGGLNALVFAAREGAVDAAKVLLEAGADANQTSADGSSPMLVAIQNGHYSVAELLLNSGADPDLSNVKGWSPLYLTVKHRNIETGTIPVPNVAQATPFIYKLLEKGADPNVRSKANTEIRNGQRATWFSEAGATPFIRAALCGDVEIMKLLLRYGADPGLVTNDRSTALMAAAGVGYAEGFIQHRSVPETIEAMRLLLDLGADINAQNDGGLTALHGAAHKAVPGEIKLLLDWGARADIRDKGRTTYGNIPGGLLPLDWAEGVTVGVQSAIYHAEAVELITNYMKEQGIPIPERTRTLGGNAKVGNVK